MFSGLGLRLPSLAGWLQSPGLSFSRLDEVPGCWESQSPAGPDSDSQARDFSTRPVPPLPRAQDSFYSLIAAPEKSPALKTQISAVSSSFSLHSATYLFWDWLNHPRKRMSFSQPAPGKWTGQQAGLWSLERFSPSEQLQFWLALGNWQGGSGCNISPPWNLIQKYQASSIYKKPRAKEGSKDSTSCTMTLHASQLFLSLSLKENGIRRVVKGKLDLDLEKKYILKENSALLTVMVASSYFQHF